MEDKDGVYGYATCKYSSFYIGGSYTDYTLHISRYSGSGLRDGLTYNNGFKFSTKDNDNDHHLIVQLDIMVDGGMEIVIFLILMVTMIILHNQKMLPGIIAVHVSLK